MNKTNFFKVVVPKIKKIFGISDVSLFRKRMAMRWGKMFFHKKYSADDLVSLMCRMGMKPGSVVCIHASMMQFYNYTGTANELITKIIDAIGPEGTLVMPAFPVAPSIPYEDYIFNPKKDKTGAGYLAETFRKYPGVLRSNNVHHSVCAIGKNAQYLIEGHTSGVNCWDEFSPWYRMCKLNALVFNLGLPRSYIGTFHHCVEGILYKDYSYWNQFFSKNQKYNFLNEYGNVESYYNLEGNLIRKTRKKQVTRFFTPEEWKISRLSNLEVKVFYSYNALKKMIELGKCGISVYYLPSTKGYKF